MRSNRNFDIGRRRVLQSTGSAIAAGTLGSLGAFGAAAAAGATTPGRLR